MSEVAIQELSLEAFQEYGTFASMLDPKCIRIGAAPIEFFRDMAQLDLGGDTIASFSVCRVESRPLAIDTIEYHSACGEALLPLDGEVVVPVAPATPEGDIPTERIAVFRVPKGTLLALRPGVWHHAPFTTSDDAVNVLVVLPQRTYANDCTVVELDPEGCIGIKE